MATFDRLFECHEPCKVEPVRFHEDLAELHGGEKIYGEEVLCSAKRSREQARVFMPLS